MDSRPKKESSVDIEESIFFQLQQIALGTLTYYDFQDLTLKITSSVSKSKIKILSIQRGLIVVSKNMSLLLLCHYLRTSPTTSFCAL